MKKIEVTFATVLLVFLVGCATRLPGFPGARLVGGGLNIKWEAPAKGTAYLVERKSGKIIETRTLAAREAFTFDATDREDQERVKVQFGNAVPPDGDFKLYFVPSPYL
jgi:hypothetical protein